MVFVTKVKQVFVDGSHLLMTIRRESRSKQRNSPTFRFEYAKMLDDIQGDDVLGEHSAVFLSHPPHGKMSYLSTEDETVFRDRSYAVRRYLLHEKRVDCYSCGRTFNQYREKPVDAALIVAIFKAALRAGQNESIVLVSGDGDFLEAVREIMDPCGGFGIPVQVYGFETSTNHEFKTLPEFGFQSLDAYLEKRRIAQVVRNRATNKAWPRTKM